MAFQDCIVSGLKQGAITREEADDLLRRFRALEEADKEGLGAAHAKMALETDLRAEAMEKKRVDALQQAAVENLMKDVRGYFMRRGADMIGAFNRVFENFNDAGYASVRSIQDALKGDATAGMADLLHNFRRSNATLKRFNRPQLDEIPAAAFKEKTSSAGKAFYDAFYGEAEKLRKMFNEAGGNIKMRDDWGLPMRHNASALMEAGLDKWREYITPRLNWDKIFDPITERPIAEADRAAVLEHVWHSVVEDGWNTKTPQMTAQGKGKLANQRQDARFLSFKDSKAWIEYNKTYGTGDVFSTMNGHIKSMARDVGLMQRLGPNPQATIEFMKQNLQAEAAKRKSGRPSFISEPMVGDGRRTVDFHVNNAMGGLDAMYDIAKGSNSPFSYLGNGLGIFRNAVMSAKLGSAVITHAFSNTAIQMMGRYIHGLPVMKALPEIIKGMGGGHEMHQAGMIAEDTLHTMERGAREQNAWTKARELSGWLPKWTTHYTGLEGLVEANRRAFFGSAMSEYANHLNAPLSEMPTRQQQTLRGGGMTDQAWEIARLAKPYEGVQNAPLLRHVDIKSVGNDQAEAVSKILGLDKTDPAQAAKASDDAALKYLGALHMATQVAVPSNNWRARSKMMLNSKEGTISGEAIRSAMMFKSGFMATFMLTQKDMLAREMANNGLGSTAAYVASSVVALMVAGLATLQTKNIVNGKDMLPMDPTTEQGRHTLMHAALTSGALGVYGDFIASDRSSFGHDMLSTIAGPPVTMATDAFSMLHSGVNQVAGAITGHPAKHPLDEEAGNTGVKFLRNNTPILSTHWALRAAFNRLIMDQLQYAADPQAHAAMRRTESRAKTETNQSYWWRPGQALPDRLPQMTTARH